MIRYARAVLVVAGVALSTLLTACAPKETPPLTPPPETVVPDGGQADAPVVKSEASLLYATAVARQDERLRRLRFLDSRGLVEFRWNDPDGQHFEQCDLRLHAVLPSKISIQASHSLKGPIARIGADGEVWWLFRFDTKPTRLEIRPFEASTDLGMAIVSPREVLGLFGFAPYPPIDVVTLIDSGDMLIVEPISPAALGGDRALATGTSPLRTIPLRYHLNRSTLLPVRIDLLGKDGAVVATSTLERYESAPADDTSAGDYPKIPTKLKLVRASSEPGREAPDGSTGSISFSLDAPTARSAGIRARLFDLKDLQSILQPDDVLWEAGALPQVDEAPSAK